FVHSGRRIARQRAQQRQRVLIAARNQHLDGGNAVRGRRVGLKQDDGGARLFERGLDRGIGFLRKCCVHRFERVRVARAEDGRGSSKALGGIEREQGERAECRLNAAA